jgi:hypothetical protein
VARPDPLTLATVVSFEDQVTARPGRGLPLASLGVAVSCAVCPTGTLEDEGVTVTLATAAGQETVMLALSDTAPGSLVATSL